MRYGWSSKWAHPVNVLIRAMSASLVPDQYASLESAAPFMVDLAAVRKDSAPAPLLSVGFQCPGTLLPGGWLSEPISSLAAS